MTTITFIRHGETTANRDRILQGSVDFPLTDTGKDQCHRLGQRLAAWQNPPSVLVSSTLSRAKASAAIIGEHLGLSPTTTEGIGEMSFGDCEGMRFVDIDKKYGSGYIQRYFRDWTSSDTPPGGESLKATLAKFRQAIDSLRTQHEGQHIAVVSHGLILRTYCQDLLGVTPGREMIRFRNTAITQVTFSEKSCYFSTICDAAHLE